MRMTNINKFWALVVLAVLAIVPVDLAVADISFQDKVDAAIDQGVGVMIVQMGIGRSLADAAGPVIVNQNKFGEYVGAVRTYENLIFSPPNRISKDEQNAGLVESLLNLQRQLEMVKAANTNIAARIVAEQARVLNIEERNLAEAQRYLSKFVFMANDNFKAIWLESRTIFRGAVDTYEEMVIRSQQVVPAEQYEEAAAQFVADRNALQNKFRDVEDKFFDLKKQAQALGRLDSAAAAEQQAQAKLYGTLTAGLVMAPPEVPPVNPPQPPEDSDQDTIPDEADNCINVANANQADMDADGEGDACDSDIDGDGVSNETDNCQRNPNADQADSDSDGAGDVCDDTLNGPPSAHEQRLAVLVERFHDYEDDYDEYERRLSRARRDEDSRDEAKYRDRLEDLLDNVEDLQEDLDDLLDDVEDERNNHELERDIKDLIDDVEKLQEDISDALGSNRASLSSQENQVLEGQFRSVERERDDAAEGESAQEVELQVLGSSYPDVARAESGYPVLSQGTSFLKEWEGLRLYAWLGTGALLAVAVLLLLVATLVRR